jgi:hypothetical protein
MIKYLIFIASLLLIPTGIIQAQNLTINPYSRYGVGLIFHNSSGRNASMGGIGIGTANFTSVNRLNPASYVDVFRTSLDLSGFYQFSRFVSDDAAESQNTAGFQNISFVFPSTRQRFSIAFGFSPYSAVGYEINDFNEVELEDTTHINVSSYSGRGGLNQGFVGFGLRISKKFRAGANFAYTFGNTRYDWLSYIQNQGSEDPLVPDPLYRPVSITQKIFVRGLGGQLGVQYADTLHRKSKTLLRLGATIDYNLEMKASRLTEYSNSSVLDTLFNSEEDGTILIPPTFGVGFEFTRPLNWSFGVDISYQNWRNFTFFQDSVFGAASLRFRAGGEYIPKYNDLKYFKRVAYRAGVYRLQTALEFNDRPITDWGVTFGFGFPTSLRKSTIFSSARINAGFQLGKRGSLVYHPMAEWYGRFQLGITVSELWFFKREVD